MKGPLRTKHTVWKLSAVVALFAGCNLGTTCANGDLFSDQNDTTSATPNQNATTSVPTPVASNATPPPRAAETSSATGDNASDDTQDYESRPDTDPGFHVIYRNTTVTSADISTNPPLAQPPPPVPSASAAPPQSPEQAQSYNPGDLVYIAPGVAPPPYDRRIDVPRPVVNGGPSNIEPPPPPQSTGVPIVQNPAYEPPPIAPRPGIPIERGGRANH